jgi:hypothetical protein
VTRGYNHNIGPQMSIRNFVSIDTQFLPNCFSPRHENPI